MERAIVAQSAWEPVHPGGTVMMRDVMIKAVQFVTLPQFSL